MLLLAKDGVLVVKTFTTFEPHTISLLYLLACCFEEVRVGFCFLGVCVCVGCVCVCVGGGGCVLQCL